MKERSWRAGGNEPCAQERSWRKAEDGLRTGGRRIVLAGNPNVGKSVLFTALTGKYREVSNYFDIALNYLLDEVRENWLKYIEEQLSLYDVYGLELDFNREPYCFPAGKKEEGRRVMLDFIRNVREITNRIGRERGKEIKLAILCPADPICAYNDGFDIAGLVIDYGP